MRNWCPLWNGIVYSSVWSEPDYVLKVFLTMLALKDKFHIVSLTAYQLSRLSQKTEIEVLDALKILSSPDTKRLEKQEFEGRRIKAVPEGWLVLNGEKYNRLVQIEQTRRRNRESQQKWRDRKKAAQPSRSERGTFQTSKPQINSEPPQNTDTTDYAQKHSEPDADHTPQNGKV